MLHPADQRLVERDRQISGLATLLDNEKIRHLLQTHYPQVEIQAITSSYLRYKPYTNCLVAYDLTVDHQPHRLYAKAFAAAHAHKLAKYQRQQKGPSSGLTPLMLTEHGIVIAPFPLDWKLKQASRLLNLDTQPPVLQTLLPHVNNPLPLVETLNYKPERRYVGRFGDKEQSWVFKVCTSRDYQSAHDRNSRVESREILRVLPLTGVSDRDQILAFPWCCDRPLAAAIAAPAEVQNSLMQVGVALAELHCQPLTGWAHADCETEAHDLMGLVPDLCHLCPPHAPQVIELGLCIAQRLLQLPPLWRLTHGDFKPEQILIQRNAVTFLDFDRAGVGHPAQDLGSFLAQLERDCLTGRLSASQRDHMAHALREGYQSQGMSISPESVELYTALHLFKLLYEPFRYRIPDWPTQMGQMLHQIEGILQRSGGHLRRSA